MSEWLFLVFGIVIFVVGLTSFMTSFITWRQSRWMIRRGLAEEGRPVGIPIAIAFQQNDRLFKEIGIKKQMAFWDQPSIDALLFAYDIRSSIREIDSLRNRRPGEDISPFLNLPVEELSPDLAKQQLSRFFFGSEPRGFRQRPDLWVSVFATHAALEILTELVNYPEIDASVDRSEPSRAAEEEVRQLIWKRFPDWLGVSERTIYQNLNSKTALIAASLGEAPTLASTHAGWASLRKMGRMKEGLEKLKGTDNARIEALGQHLTSDDKGQAFSDQAGEKPAVCATHLAVALIGRLKPDVKQDFLDRLKIGDGAGIVTFVNACWVDDGDAGGYCWSPDGGKPTLVHTRYALALLRSLEGWRQEKKEQKFKLQTDPVKILKLMNSTYGPNGLSLTKDTAPSLYATRAAMLSIKYLEILRIWQVLQAGEEYVELRDRFFEKFRSASESILRCYWDSNYDGYRGFCGNG